jgi:hypothetical protein
VLFLIIGVCAAGGILLWTARFDVAILLIIAIWAFAQLYYFAFYVIGHYIDPNYKFSGLRAFVLYLLRKHSCPVF